MHLSYGQRLAALVAIAAVACSPNDASPGRADTDGGDAAVPLFADGGIVGDPLASDAALELRVQAVFASCAGIRGEESCHASGAGGLHLQLLPDGGDVVRVPSMERPELLRVAPGDAENSYLYLKVLGDGGIDGSRMPAGTPDFDPRLPALIQAWIEAGAPLPPGT